MEIETDEWCVAGSCEGPFWPAGGSRAEAVAEGMRQWRSALSGRDEDCFAPGARPAGEAAFYVGAATRFAPDVDEDKVLEDVLEQAFDFGGECAEDWLDDLSEGERKRLRALLQGAFDAWMDAEGRRPRFFVARAVEEVSVAACLRGREGR